MSKLFVWFVFGCGSGPAALQGPPPAPAVKVVTVAPGAATEALALTGAVEAEETAVLRPEATGPVAHVGFEHGQAVREGDVLLRLRDNEARAAVDEATARVALAETQLGRTRSLFERQNASQADVDRDTAEAALARAQLDRAKEQLRKTVIRAPFDGVVGLREVSIGEVVDPSRAVTRIDALDQVVVDVEVPERWLPRLAVGLPAQVEIEALPGEPFAGEIVFVGPRVTEGSRTAPIRIRIPNEGGRIRPGMSARVNVTTATLKDALLLPAGAVVTTASGSSVWVVDAEGVVTPRPVRVADRGAEQVRVVEGLIPGDRVVVEGLLRLRPGVTVRVEEATR